MKMTTEAGESGLHLTPVLRIIHASITNTKIAWPLSTLMPALLNKPERWNHHE